MFREQLLRELGPHSALLSDPMRKVGPDPTAYPKPMRPVNPDPNPMRQLLEEDPGGEGLASERTLQILRRVATGAESVIACADTIVEEAAGSGTIRLIVT